MLPFFLFKFKTGFLYGSLLLPLKESQTLLAKPSQNFKLFSQFWVTNSNFWKSKSTLWDYYELWMAPFSVAETSFHTSLQSCMFCLFYILHSIQPFLETEWLLVTDVSFNFKPKHLISPFILLQIRII